MKKEIEVILRKGVEDELVEDPQNQGTWCVDDLIFERIFKKGIKHGEKLEREKIIQASKRGRNTMGVY